MTYELEDEDILVRGMLAKVLAVNNGGRKVQFRLTNGQSLVAQRSDPFQFKVGDVAIYDENAAVFEPVAKKHWPVDSWIGIVKAKLDTDLFVVDVGGKLLKMSAASKSGVSVGNTVEGETPGYIKAVLLNEPLRYLDLGDIDEAAVARFRHKKGTGDQFADIGGYQDVVAQARELIETPLQKKEQLAQIGVRIAKGGLFTGDPGTGKTMLARAIANETSANFYEISGPEVLSKYIGQSEELIRMIFKEAIAEAPSIVFFDEIDSLAGQRSDNSHESTKKIVAQLLTQIDGFKSSDGVIVIATTNRPEDVDTALLRPGRFDWVIHFPLPDERERREILEKSQPKGVDGALDLAQVAASTDKWSPADLVSIWTTAGLIAAKNDRVAIDAEDFSRGVARAARRRLAKINLKPAEEK